MSLPRGRGWRTHSSQRLDRREISDSRATYSRPRQPHHEDRPRREDSYVSREEPDSYVSREETDSYVSREEPDSYVSRAPEPAPTSQKREPVVRNLASNAPSSAAKIYQLKKATSNIITPEHLPNNKWKIAGENVTYTLGNEVIMEFDRNLPKERTWNKTIWFPVNPKCIVDSVTLPSKLPTPISKTNIPKECLMHPAMMMLPKPKFVQSHSGKCQCIVLGQRETYHRESVLYDSCLTNDLKQKEVAVPPCAKEPFVENPSRFYYWDSVHRDHCLALPMPFRNGSSWTPIHYSPAMSNCPSNPAKELYYKLYDSTKAKAIGSVYMRSPKEWTAGNHPCISEAAEGSELGYITSNMYGIETVPRANYTNHPLADQHFLLFVATDLITMMVPIFLRNPHDPSAMDDVIGRMTTPFWKNGLGKVMCPVCIAEDISGELRPVLLSRSQFISHWIQLHLSSLTAVCTFSATGLNSRIYQGFIVYMLARQAVNVDKLEDKPEGNPLDRKSVLKENYVFGLSPILSFLKPKPAPLNPEVLQPPRVPAPQPQQVSAEPEVPGSSEQPPEEESMEIDHVDQFKKYLLQDDPVSPEPEGYRKTPDPSDESVVKANVSKKKKK